MADYSIALGVQPPRIDAARAFAQAAEIRRTRTAEQATALALENAQRERMGETQRQNALRTYNERAKAGDKGAMDELMQFPDLAGQVLGLREKMDSAQRTKFDQNAMQAARDAQRILALPAGPEREQAFIAELQKDLAAGEISKEDFDLYSRVGPDEQLLNGIIQQAMPISDIYARQDKDREFNLKLAEANRKAQLHPLEQQKLEAEIAKTNAEARPSGPFTGQSVEAQALNHLVATKQLTEEQAAQIGAGKTITDPSSGAIIFMTPDGIFKQKPRGGVIEKDMNLTPEEQAAGPGVVLTGPARMNESQSASAIYADRIANALPVIKENEKAGLSVWNQGVRKLPGGNLILSEEMQQLDQAERDFINATLRRESGAVINPDEFKNAERQYLPRPGDTDAVLKQKKKNRDTVLNAMQRSAGPSYKAPKPVVKEVSDKEAPADDEIDRLLEKYGK